MNFEQSWDLPLIRRAVMKAIGEHNYQYDFGDSSEREDAVQIVLEALVKVATRD